MSEHNSKQKKQSKIAKPKKKDIIAAILIIAIALGGTFGVFAILKVSLKTEIPLVVVISESMEPTIYRGDLLIVQGKAPAEIKNGTASDLQGDIIIYDANGLWLFRQNSEPIVHRVVGKYLNTTDNKYYFITKGDNNATNPDPDPPGSPLTIAVPEDRVLGVVVKIIPKVGMAKIWLSENNMGIPMIVILGVLLLISIVWDLTHPEDEEEEKDEKQKALAAIKEKQNQKEENIGNQDKKSEPTTDPNFNMGI
jgi:signal peptidase